MLSRHLELTEAQEEQVETIFAAARAKRQALRGELGDLRREIGESIRENGYQEDQVRIQVESAAPKMVDLMVLRIGAMAQVYELLTPEQQTKADEWFERGPRFGRGRRHGGGSESL